MAVTPLSLQKTTPASTREGVVVNRNILIISPSSHFIIGAPIDVKVNLLHILACGPKNLDIDHRLFGSQPIEPAMHLLRE